MAARRPPAIHAATAEKMRRALRPYPPEGRYLVGVSGGRDSVALLHLLRESGYGELVVCHLDHALRPESARDAEFVGDLARGWQCAVAVERVDVAALARARKISVETAARDARRAFFVAVGGCRRCGDLFLAHQADDQVETFLFRLLRGAGPAGLAAMRPEALLPAGASPLRILRPLLGIWREEIDRYVRLHRLPFREDPSNADPAHTRNRIRAQVLPMLDREMGRSVRPALWRAAEVLGAEERWLSDWLEAEPAPGKCLIVKDLRAQPLARQRRVVRRWLSEQQAPTVGFDEVDLILSLLDAADGPARINLPGGWHARRRAGGIFLAPP